MVKQKNKQKLYLNPKQREFLAARQKTKTMLAGRGFGKSTVAGVSARQKVSALPRGKIFFASTTYNQILTKTLPAVENMWEQMGFREHLSNEQPGHYVIGRKPPKHFERPYSPPRKYQNVLTFINGFTIEFLSLDRSDWQRGGSYDGGEIDEAALLKREVITRVLLPSVRGNRHRFSHWLHQNVNMYSSVPWMPRGYWLFEYEEKSDVHPEDYFFLEATAYDNVAVLGEDGIKRLEMEMSYLEFQVEVLNRRIVKVPDGFYHKFNDEKHTYKPRFVYGENDRGITVDDVEDVIKSEILELSFDFSGWFNCLTVWQEKDGVEYLRRQFFVKGDDKIDKLITNFCDHFKQHGFKFVRIWGEPRGHDKQALTSKSIYETIRDLLIRQGWDVEISVQPERTTGHLERHHFVNEILSETNPMLPKIRINEECKDVIIAIQVTQITAQFKKDKSNERDRNYPQEHAAHFTDTIDYYLDQKHGWKFNDDTNQRSGTTMYM